MPRISQQRKDDLVAKETAKIEAIFDFLKPPNSTDASYNEWLTYKPRMLTTMIKTELEEIHKSQQLTRKLCKDIEKEHAPKKDYHLTLNFPPVIEENEVYWERTRDVKRYCDKLSYINRFGFCNEFYTKSGFHHHIHIALYDINATKDRIIRDFSNKFKLNRNFIQLHLHNHVDRLEDYITGKKADVDKEPFLVKDDIFRNERSITHYFFTD